MEEISLRELIEILLRQKKIIIGITLICMLTAFVVSFFVLDPIYESKAILMATSIENKTPQQAEGVKGLLDTMAQYPQMSIQTYKEQINNPHILQQTINELNLQEYDITRRSLQNMISLNTLKDTNLITISVQYHDKKIATDIVNTIARKFTDFVSNNAKTQATKSSNYIKQQMEIEKKNLDQVLIEYKEYLAKPRGKNELEQEVNSKLELITQYKTELVNAEIEEKKIKAALNVSEQTLKDTPDKITLNKALSEEPYLAQIAKDEAGQSAKDLFSVQVQSEEINDAYIELRKQIDILKIELAKTSAQRNNLKRQIENTQKELENLQVDLAEKQHEEQLITQKVDVAQKTYDAFLEKYEETRIAKSSAIGDATISIVSPGVEPLFPVGPKKALNMAIATVLGMMIGVFVAFFIDYWKNSAIITVNSNETKAVEQ